MRLREAIAAAKVQCQAYIDRLVVRTDENTVFEPDAMVRWGAQRDDSVVEVSDPVIVVEVVAPSSGKRDTGLQRAGYFSLPSVMHYLVVLTETRVVVHHARQHDGTILTRIVAQAAIRVDPPSVTLRDVFTLD